MAHLVMVRGLPGTGKTSFSKAAYPTYEHMETDHLFIKDGIYQFDPKMLPSYHNLVRLQTLQHLEHGKNVVVSNTFSRIWEMKPYLDMPYTQLTVFNMNPAYKDSTTVAELAQRNVHGVPAQTIENMVRRWEGYIDEYFVRY